MGARRIFGALRCFVKFRLLSGLPISDIDPIADITKNYLAVWSSADYQVTFQADTIIKAAKKVTFRVTTVGAESKKIVDVMKLVIPDPGQDMVKKLQKAMKTYANKGKAKEKAEAEAEKRNPPKAKTEAEKERDEAQRQKAKASNVEAIARLTTASLPPAERPRRGSNEERKRKRDEEAHEVKEARAKKEQDDAKKDLKEAKKAKSPKWVSPKEKPAKGSPPKKQRK